MTEEDEEVGGIWALAEQISEMHRKQDEKVEETPSNWKGHDMEVRTMSTGLRIATLNTGRKFCGGEVHWEIIRGLMDELEIDIMALTEAGKADEMKIAAIKNWAVQYGSGVEVTTRSNTSIQGTIVVLVGAKWAKIKRTVTYFKPKTAEKDRLLAIEFDNNMEGEHNKVLLITYYGYNASNMCKEEVKEMHEWVWKQKSKFKKDRLTRPFLDEDMALVIETL